MTKVPWGGGYKTNYIHFVIIFILSFIFRMTKALISYWISHSYSAELWWHLSNKNVLQTTRHCFSQNQKRHQMESFSNSTPGCLTIRLVTLPSSARTVQCWKLAAICVTAGTPRTLVNAVRGYVSPDNWPYSFRPAVHTDPSGDKIKLIPSFKRVMLYYKSFNWIKTKK